MSSTRRVIKSAETFLTAACSGQSVALVGAGPILLEGAGNVIDSHDMVVRINVFDLAKDPQSSGTRVSLWVHNGHLRDKMAPHPELPQIVTKSYVGPLLSEFNKMYDYHLVPCMYFFRNETIHLLDSLVAPKALTTGGRILAFLLSQIYCIKRISVFGFTFYSKSLPRYHTRESNPHIVDRSVQKWHDPDRERALFMGWNEPKLTIHV